MSQYFRRFDMSSEYTRVLIKQYRRYPPVNKALVAPVTILLWYSLYKPLSSLTAQDIRICYGDRDDQLQTAEFSGGAFDDINHELDVCYTDFGPYCIVIYSKLVTTFYVDIKTELHKFIEFRCRQSRLINLKAEICGKIIGQPVSSATVSVRIRNTVSQPTELSRNDNSKRSTSRFLMTSGDLQIPDTIDIDATISCNIKSYELIKSEKAGNLLFFI
jgi:hypothetical protein